MYISSRNTSTGTGGELRLLQYSASAQTATVLSCGTFIYKLKIIDWKYAVYFTKLNVYIWQKFLLLYICNQSPVKNCTSQKDLY